MTWRQWRLSKQLLFWLMLLTLIPLLLLGWLITYQLNVTEQALIDKKANEMTTLLLADSIYFERFITNRFRELEFMASIDSFTESNIDGMNELLTNKADIGDNYDSLYFVDTTGTGVVGVISSNERAAILSSEEANDFLAVDREWFIRSLNGSPAISDPLQSRATGNRIIALSVPIVNSSEVIGVLRGAILIDRLIERVGISDEQGQTEMYLVDSNGIVMTETLRKAPGDRVEPEILQLLQDPNGTAEYEDSHGREVIGAFQQLELLDWTVIIEEPIEEAFVTASALRNQFYLFVSILVAVTIIIISIVATYLSKTLTTPVTSMLEDVKQAANGEWKDDKPIEGANPSSKNEIHQLAHYFTMMKKQLYVSSSELRRANSKLEKLSYMDGLTNISNRRYFDKRLSEVYLQATTDNYPLSLLLIDIDCFKKYNDTYGHVSGDACLRAVAQALEKATPEGAVVARYGGEEFAIILPAYSHADSKPIGEAIVRSMTEVDIEHSSSTVADHVTVSLGGYTATSFMEANSIEDLLNHADSALYAAKELGRNQAVFYEEGEQKRPMAR
ncbi:diguanylate cyclase [Paenalkalicoccus suaedae]|uniref:Diguanylate cyclase n=1 Tax=Paenalkalicoccus suaedae TaxID=2592382 RepID=A0A859FC64_9BACI|nr:diguanylate cyclase [Paenalkalicoccus suaedae]QKS70154.1 diguanylate cyclase [Paenalkalicoccus suaedae]